MRARMSSLVACGTALATLSLAGSAAAAPGLSEVLTSGGAGSTPDLTLRASLAAQGSAPPATAAVGFGVDGGLVSKTAFKALAAAPSGTQIGYVMTDLTGRTAQLPLRKTTVAGSGAARTVQLTIDTPGEQAAIAGPTLPATAKQTANGRLQLDVNLRDAQQKLAAAGQQLPLAELDLTLYGTLGGAPFVVVPQTTRAVQTTMTVQACTGTTCQPGEPQRDAATVTLPKSVALDAPATATYGRAVHFAGIRSGGDAVDLWVQEGRGLYLAVRNVHYATTQPGSFQAYAPLRSIFNADHDLVQPASGRYVIADVEKGKAVVLGVADHDTSVHVARPKLRIHHVGSKVRVWVTVPGGNSNFTTTIKLAKRTVAVGRLHAGGTFTALIPRPQHMTTLRVFAKVRGAATALATRPLAP